MSLTYIGSTKDSLLTPAPQRRELAFIWYLKLLNFPTIKIEGLLPPKTDLRTTSSSVHKAPGYLRGPLLL